MRVQINARVVCTFPQECRGRWLAVDATRAAVRQRLPPDADAALIEYSLRALAFRAWDGVAVFACVVPQPPPCMQSTRNRRSTPRLQPAGAGFPRLCWHRRLLVSIATSFCPVCFGRYLQGAEAQGGA